MSWDQIVTKLDTMSRYLKRPIPTKDLARQMQALDFEGMTWRPCWTRSRGEFRLKSVAAIVESTPPRGEVR